MDADRAGIRAKFRGYLGRAEIPMQIDVGFSDEIASVAEVMNYPTLLDDLAYPQIKSYPIKSVVAEKFHAMQRFARAPSRWKDYYDLWLILGNFEIEDESVHNAILMTFENRATPVPTARPISLTPDFGAKYRENWLAFLRKNQLQHAEIDDLLTLVEKLWAFLEWPIVGLATSNAPRNPRRWRPRERKWS